MTIDYRSRESVREAASKFRDNGIVLQQIIENLLTDKMDDRYLKRIEKLEEAVKEAIVHLNCSIGEDCERKKSKHPCAECSAKHWLKQVLEGRYA